MDMRRKVAMVVATLAVALGIGHLMQSQLPDRTAAAETPADKPVGITPLAAGVGIADTDTEMAPESMVLSTADALELPASAMNFGKTPAATAPDMKATGDVMSPDMPGDSMADTAAAGTTAAGTTADCQITLDVAASEKATLNVTLLAPCRPGERVVLRHGGLVFTAKTSAAGSAFIQLPGMEENGVVSAMFNDGTETEGSAVLSDMAIYQRFAVQWLADDAFQVNAYENGASYGQPGHILAASSNLVATSMPSTGGYITRLGNTDVALPMQAEVYTYPLDPTAKISITVEAAITPATCNRELLGELLESRGGSVTSTDLMMMTPDCTAIGDVLVLNNPLAELTLAAAN